MDVGSGTGALGAWLARRLNLPLHLVDRDRRVRAVAQAAFPDVTVHASLGDAPRVALVLAMEVLEHVAPAEQRPFTVALWTRVAPGGLLVVSTPDESRYLGRWSGYAPHIGPLDADALRALLERAALVAAPEAAEAMVWRLEGDPFSLGPVKRVVQPIANRTWTLVEPYLARVTHRLAGPAAALADRVRDTATAGVAPHVHAVPAPRGRGTGLLGVVRRRG